MTLQLLINGTDYTDKWRPYESRWTQRAWMGESAQSEFAIDDFAGAVAHADLMPRKIVEVWEDASGSSVCLYHGRIANKTLGMGASQTQPAMRWTVFTEDFNIELRGIIVAGVERDEETDDDRVEWLRLEYLNGAASVSPKARNSTDLDGNFIGGTPGDAVTIPAEDYTDTNPADVLQRIAEAGGRIFFVYLTDDGDGELVYFSRGNQSILADISITDDGEDDGADGVDIYAAYKTAQAGDHGGQDVLSGAAIRYTGGYHSEGDVGGAQSTYDKWEDTIFNDAIRNDAHAENVISRIVENRDENLTYFATIDMLAENAHRLRAGMWIPSVRLRRANKGGTDGIRAVSVTHEPIHPDEDGNAMFRVSMELGRPQIVRTFPKSRRRIPRPPDPATPGTVTTGRLYYTNADDVTSGLDDEDYSANWDGAGSAGGDVDGPKRLRATPQDTLGNSGSGFMSGGGFSVPAGRIVSGLYTCLLSEQTGLLAAVQNGAAWRTVIRSRNAFGIGVNDAAQQNFPSAALRVWRPGTSSFIGTILDVGDWEATVRFDPGPAWPSIPMQATGGAVASAASTDYLVLDLGGDHQAPITGATGWTYRPADSSDEDLPFVVDSVADQNAWLEFSGTSGGTAGPGDDLTGTDVGCYAQCDHKHHVIRERAPTPADDEAGYPAGTFWVQVDETSDPTEIIATYLSVDDAADAAVWLIQSPLPTDPPGSTALVIEEEDAGPSGTFDTLKVPDDSLTDNGDGSASLAYLLPSHGERSAVNTVAASGSTETLDLADGNVHDVTLTDDCTFTFAGAAGGVECRFRLIMRQDSTGSRVPTFPGSVVWPNDTEPTWSTDADAVDIVEFTTIDGGTTWFGDAGGSSGGGASSLDDLTDVTITSPEADQQLQYVGGVWVNNHRRWEPVTTNPGSGPEIVFDGDDIVMTWADYS